MIKEVIDLALKLKEAQLNWFQNQGKMAGEIEAYLNLVYQKFSILLSENGVEISEGVHLPKDSKSP